MESDSIQEAAHIPQDSFEEPILDVLNAYAIGSVAGSVWNYLNANGAASVIKLKSEISCTATILHLALGWLLREDKIELSREKGHLMVKLK